MTAKHPHSLLDIRIVAIAGFALIVVFTIQNYWAQRQISILFSSQRMDIVRNSGTAISSILFERSLRQINSTEMLAATESVAFAMHKPSEQAVVRMSDVLSRFIINTDAKEVCFFGANGSVLFPCAIDGAKPLAAQSAKFKIPKFSIFCHQNECSHYIAVPTLHDGQDVGVVVAKYGLDEVFQTLEKITGTQTSIRQCRGVKESETAKGILEVEFGDVVTGLPEGYGLPKGYCYQSRVDIRKESATIEKLANKQVFTSVASISLLGFILLLLYMSDRRSYQERLIKEALAKQKKSDTLDRASRNFEGERRMLATELHDELGQRLVPIRFNISILRSMISGKGLTELENISKTIETEIESMSRGVSDLVNSLRPPLLDTMGLKGSIEAIVDEYQVVLPRCRIKLTIAESVDLDHLDDPSKVAIYRVVQESLTNITKHATRATRVKITISGSEKWVSVQILDNGPGFLATDAKSGGVGLRGMKERAFAMNGKCLINSTPKKGTSILFELPVHTL